MWVSRKKIISSIQKKKYSQNERITLKLMTQIWSHRGVHFYEKTGDRGRHRGPRGPRWRPLFLWKRTPWCDWNRAMSLDFKKYAAKGVIGDLSAVALYTRSHTAAPILLPYRSRIPNPIIPYRTHTAAPILLPYRSHIPNPTIPYRSSNLLRYRSHTVPIPFQYRLHTVPYRSSLRSMARSMAPYCKQYHAIPVWMEYWSSLSNARATPQFFCHGVIYEISKDNHIGICNSSSRF